MSSTRSQREVETIDGDLKRFAALEKINLAKAVAGDRGRSRRSSDGAAARAPGSIQVRAPQLPPGIRFARVVKVHGAGALATGSGGCSIAENSIGDDQRDREHRSRRR